MISEHARKYPAIAQAEMGIDQRFSISVPSSLHYRVKIACVYTNRSASVLLSKIIDAGLREMEKKGVKKYPMWKAAIKGIRGCKKVQKQTRRGSGFVYLFKAETGHFKIGSAKSVDSRLSHFGILLPFKIELIHALEVVERRSAEKVAHSLFADKRTNGEWFLLDESDIERFRNLSAADLSAAK